MGNQILLIDDDKDLVESLKLSLKLSGHSIIATTSAIEGLEMYKKFLPCLVFLDAKMPEMSGYELFFKIREEDSLAKIILITGHEDEKQSDIAKKNGLIEVLTKPVEMKVLNDRIKENNC